MGKKQLTYQEALHEIEDIVAHIEANKFSIDELGEKVKRVAELVKFCKEKLKFTEHELNKIIEENRKEEQP